MLPYHSLIILSSFSESMFSLCMCRVRTAPPRKAAESTLQVLKQTGSRECYDVIWIGQHELERPAKVEKGILVRELEPLIRAGPDASGAPDDDSGRRMGGGGGSGGGSWARAEKRALEILSVVCVDARGGAAAALNLCELALRPSVAEEEALRAAIEKVGRGASICLARSESLICLGHLSSFRKKLHHLNTTNHSQTDKLSFKYYPPFQFYQPLAD